MTQVKVCSTDAVKPGTMACFKIQDRTVLVALVDGHFHAMDGICSHEDAVLCLGALKDGWIKCPLHNSRFDILTGQPLEEPATDPITIYKTEIRDQAVYVDL